MINIPFFLNSRNMLYLINITHIDPGENGPRMYRVNFSDGTCKHFNKKESYDKLMLSLPDTFFKPDGINGIVLNSVYLKGIEKRYDGKAKRETFIARMVGGKTFEWTAASQDVDVDISEIVDISSDMSTSVIEPSRPVSDNSITETSFDEGNIGGIDIDLDEDEVMSEDDMAIDEDEMSKFFLDSVTTSGS